jgi:hypothetical protein
VITVSYFYELVLVDVTLIFYGADPMTWEELGQAFKQVNAKGTEGK